MQNYTIDEWSKLDKETILEFAQNLCHSVTPPLSLSKVYSHSYCGKRLWIAEFLYDGASFIYIPGGVIEIGFDEASFVPSPAQIRSYKESAETYELPEHIVEFITSVTTPRREIELNSFLVEASPQEIGVMPVDADSLEVQALIEQCPSLAKQFEIHKEARIIRNHDGSYRAYKIVPTTHSQLTQTLYDSGFRLLRSDEWEYLCGFRTKTLFRWGNDCPCDRYPTDNTAAEVRRKKEWLFSKGKKPFVPDTPDWDFHLQKNLFGLTIAQNPYDWEIVSEKDIIRGGDGGCNICGGSGFFMGWLPLASSYLDPYYKEWDEVDISNSYMRRVIDIL